MHLVKFPRLFVIMRHAIQKLGDRHERRQLVSLCQLLFHEAAMPGKQALRIVDSREATAVDVGL